jgi:diguanylate cyclase (GGDEF)-like protein/PAS domain S-box-containing protein
MENKFPIKHRFFSLQWKVALLFGGVLLLFNGLFPFLVHWSLMQRFEFSRNQIQQTFQQELVGQLKSTSEQIQRLAGMSLIQDNISKEAILTSLEQYQIKLQLDWNITQAQLFDDAAIYLGGWGKTIPISLKNAILRTLTSEQATNLIDCSQTCKQYDLIPVLYQGKTRYILMLSYDLSSTLVTFSNKTAADVAVLTRNISSVAKDHILTNWNMAVSALTSFQKNMPFLQELAQHYSFDSLANQNTIFRNSEFPVEFNLVTPSNNNELYFILIDDISQQRQEIIATTLQSLVIALLSVLVLGGGLFIFISKPLSRLSAVSQALPLLAKQKYDQAKKLVRNKTTDEQIDELDQLEISTLDLTLQLEQLHYAVKEHADSLHLRSLELQQERDFVKSLIDTAQLIIVTLDSNRKITSFNAYAERLTGYLEQQLINTPIQNLFPEQQWSSVEKELIKLQSTPGAVSQQETEFIHNDGSIRIISWLHSRLDHPSEASTVLSVGLDITEKKRSERQLLWLAEHDVLTGLNNRRKFNLEFENILELAGRFNHQGSLLFLDLDQFKDLNDSCGHKAGDLVLQQVADVLNSFARNTDVIARLGGDEFAMILPETDANGAITVAQKITEQIAKLNVSFNKVHYKVTTSIGIIQFPQVNLSIDELMSNADLAMYQAKANGRNTWHMFSLDDQTRSQLESRLFWKQKIENALEHNRFIFHYQPIFDIQKQTIAHYEVLIRMKDEDGTLHLPGTFIQVAEQTGLIHNIDHFVLQQGIYKQAELDKRNLNISLSLNLSGHAVDDPFLLPLLKRLLKESHANPENIIFELTETAAVADILQAKEFMQQMNALGCRFSLDDFGTGFASFHYMRELPVDIVKIDGAFISNLTENTDDQLFVKALVDVAKGMGKKTIAEFVEKEETLALLKELGVDYAQGYYIGKPQESFLFDTLNANP